MSAYCTSERENTNGQGRGRQAIQQRSRGSTHFYVASAESPPAATLRITISVREREESQKHRPKSELAACRAIPRRNRPRLTAYRTILRTISLRSDKCRSNHPVGFTREKKTAKNKTRFALQTQPGRLTECNKSAPDPPTRLVCCVNQGK